MCYSDYHNVGHNWFVCELWLWFFLYQLIACVLFYSVICARAVSAAINCAFCYMCALYSVCVRVTVLPAKDNTLLYYAATLPLSCWGVHAHVSYSSDDLLQYIAYCLFSCYLLHRNIIYDHLDHHINQVIGDSTMSNYLNLDTQNMKCMTVCQSPPIFISWLSWILVEGDSMLSILLLLLISVFL